MKRYDPSPQTGLSEDEVAQRIKDGLVNTDSPIRTKPVSRIILDNTLTLFNLINLIIAVALFAVGSYRNMLFCGVVVCNLFIGILQEIRAKIATDKLTLINQTEIKVIRQSVEKKVKSNKIVLDDILLLNNGDCLVCDCVVVQGRCEVNEALITGESDPIAKSVGDTLLSGSYIVSGSCRAKAEKIGEQHYASKISNGAKYIKKTNSQIMKALKSIIRIVSIMIFPTGALLFCKNFFSHDLGLRDSIESAAAALIGMIPEGLILLVSTVLAVSVVRLSRKKVLVQDLYCIETLARVDTLCLDKTGTITEGKMTLEDVIYISDKDAADDILTCFTSCAGEDTNPTFEAIKTKFAPDTNHTGYDFTPFSSSRKYSALTKDQKTYYLGAGEVLCPDEMPAYSDILPTGRRIITLCCDKKPLCFIVIKDIIKKNAKNILDYFRNQGVDIKIISGDSALSASAAAKEAGVENSQKAIDTVSMKTPKDFAQAAGDYTVFGRVTPQGKEALIKALQQNGHTVAMTGDGVNDVLALKAADCSIAMANGSAAARNVSHLILLDSDFASLPKVVYEGRRSINNIKRSASMFLVKTLFTIILSLVHLFIDLPYPFIPIQLTLISVMTIGIPSFMLALEPSDEMVSESFLSDIFKKALPTALSVFLNITILSALALYGVLPQSMVSTIATLTTGFCGLYLLFKLCLPFNTWRAVLLTTMTAGFYATALIFWRFFEFSPLSYVGIAVTAILSVLSVLFFEVSQRIIKFISSRIA